MHDDDLTFGQWLQRRRKGLHLTQQQLGELARCAAETIRKYEAGVRHPSLQLATQLADCLGLAGGARATFLASAREVGGNAAGTTPVASPVEGNRGALPPSARRSNLPHQLTSFVGRTQEIALTKRLLQPAAHARLSYAAPNVASTILTRSTSSQS